MAGYTYSFLDIKAALVGPGAVVNMGQGATLADEGITVLPADAINTMTPSADGSGMHSLHAFQGGQVQVHTLKDSPLNSIFMTLYAAQTAAGANHGQNTITISNINSGDVITCQQCAFQKAPELRYGKEGGMMTWVFDCIQINRALG